MNYSSIRVTGIIIALLIISFGSAQSDNHPVDFGIPEVALVDVEPESVPVSLSIEPPLEAGLPPSVGSSGTDNSTWINYTSAIAPAVSRVINVQLTAGDMPQGLEIQVIAGSYNGIGNGLLGSPAGTVTLSVAAQNLINGIGGCYTGDGLSNGHQLTYSLLITDPGVLDPDESTTLEVTYTLSDF